MENEPTGDSSIKFIWLMFITPVSTSTVWLYTEENGVDLGALSLAI